MPNHIPIYYIRFLKPPPTSYIVGQHFIIVWTIESDLGDQTYYESIPVICSLQGSSQLGLRVLATDSKSNKTKKPSPSSIKPHTQDTTASLSPDIQIEFDALRGGGIVTKLVIEPLPGKPIPLGSSVNIQLSMILSPIARSTLKSHVVWQNAYKFNHSIWVLPTWSAPIEAMVAKQRHGDATSGDQAERILRVAIGDKKKIVRIREDAVQSIARHVWDCGLGMCQYLSESKIDSKFDTLLELGSGTGLVGIYAAMSLSPKHVYLTDLPDALEIMQQNVDLNELDAQKASVAELAWGPRKQQDKYEGVNLVLLTDVLYNQSSHDVLLETLNWLLENKGCKALLAYKERNPDERDFFTKIESKGWKCTRVGENIEDIVCEVYWIEK